jgi:hypothetical protein
VIRMMHLPACMYSTWCIVCNRQLHAHVILCAALIRTNMRTHTHTHTHTTATQHIYLPHPQITYSLQHKDFRCFLFVCLIPYTARDCLSLMCTIMSIPHPSSRNIPHKDKFFISISHCVFLCTLYCLNSPPIRGPVPVPYA